MANTKMHHSHIWGILYKVAVLLLLSYIAVRLTLTTEVHLVNTPSRIAITQFDRKNPLRVQIDQPWQRPVPVGIRQPVEVKTVE